MRCQHPPGARKEVAARRVEVVLVVVVGEQHDVDVADRVGRESGAAQLGQVLVVAGRRKGRVGHPAQGRVLEHRGGATDEREVIHRGTTYQRALLGQAV
jgi:hypothetical protein